MNVKHEQFIGIYENAFSKEYCDDLIRAYDLAIEVGYGLQRQDNEPFSKLYKCDTQLFNSCGDIRVPLPSVKNFHNIFWNVCYPLYQNEYPLLKESAPHANYGFKIQKTNLREGYHVWHYESSTRETSNRLLAWMVYLNDVQDGGETEFLYQSMRIKPKQGTLVIWPAAFTHGHRGNPPLTEPKYIITGWTEF
jgi:hypothetical protein